MCLILERRVIDPLSPKNTANHLAMIDLSILEKHPTVMFKRSFKEIATV